MIDHLRALRLFTRIVELGSFSRAAEQLGLNRAAATHSIQQLERHLGVRLLARTTRQVTPTVEGAAYYERCVAILADLDEADAQFTQAARVPEGRIRLDLSAAMFRNVLAPALPEFSARYPQIRLEVSVTDRPIDLVREGVDCVLRAGDLRDVPLVARRLAHLPQVTCASAEYLAATAPPARWTRWPSTTRWTTSRQPRAGRCRWSLWWMASCSRASCPRASPSTTATATSVPAWRVLA